MTKIAEDSQWYKGRRGISKEYLQGFHLIERAVGGKGFLYRPGYLGGAITELETDSKFKLSDLNYEIVAKAIERELAQTGHDYDITYKEALIAWELEKTITLTALEQEFADLKYTRELDMARLDTLEIETNLRKLVIISTKAQIREDLEALDQEMVEIKYLTFSAETALMNEKRTTGTKKLEVIPYIEAILAKQGRLLAASEDNVDRKEALITAKEAVIVKKEELITAKEAIADKFTKLIAVRELLNTAKEEVSTAKQSLLDQEKETVDQLIALIDEQGLLNEAVLNVINAKKLTAEKLPDLITAKEELIDAKDLVSDAKDSLLTQEQLTLDQMDLLIDEQFELNDARQDIIDARAGIIEKLDSLLEAKQDLITAKQAVSVAKQSLLVQETATVAQLTTLSGTLQGLNEAHQRVITAKKALLPYMVLKAEAQQDYALEVAAWIIVKKAIAAVKEEIAALKEIEGDNRALIMAEKQILNGLELSLKEARINLQVAKLAGHKTITETKMSELGETLEKEEDVLTRELAEESSMMGARVDLDEYLERKILDTRIDVRNIVFPAERDMIRRIISARAEELEKTAEIASEAELTSELIHLIG